MAETTQRSANEHGGSVSSATQHSDRGSGRRARLRELGSVGIGELGCVAAQCGLLPVARGALEPPKAAAQRVVHAPAEHARKQPPRVRAPRDEAQPTRERGHRVAAVPLGDERRCDRAVALLALRVGAPRAVHARDDLAAQPRERFERGLALRELSLECGCGERGGLVGRAQLPQPVVEPSSSVRRDHPADDAHKQRLRLALHHRELTPCVDHTLLEPPPDLERAAREHDFLALPVADRHGPRREDDERLAVVPLG